jgi:predicted transcriptional regulator
MVALLAVSVCFTAAGSGSERPFFFSDIQHIDSLHEFSATVPIAVGAGLHGNTSPPLQQPTRLEIYNCIKEHQGIHFRGICQTLELQVGVVQYHLGVLEHAGLINSVSDGQNKRYFEHSIFNKTDVTLVSLMRHDTTARILTCLAQNDTMLHRDIASHLGVSSQALSWQMKQLKQAGIVDAEKISINVRYSLVDPEMAEHILNLRHL